MQFFVILLALIPVIIVVLKETGGIHGLFNKLATQGTAFTHPWNGTSLGGRGRGQRARAPTRQDPST
ncbi:MAG TPA: hypothetical protein VMK84_29355 [Streptosporangiaceae bacterium]|nr:hypothetical protein [Streptosporangiaceae bacterium]